MDSFKLLKERNNISSGTLQRCFRDFCAASQTTLRTTSMYLSVQQSREILNRYDITDCGMLKELAGSQKTVFVPTVMSFLQAASSKGDRVFALIIVDVQNDFISGSLQVCEGALTVPVINELGPHFQHVYKTADWHPANHISFHSNVKSGLYATCEKSVKKGADSNLFDTVTVIGPPELDQTLWPDHCIQGSKGAEYHPDLAVFPGEVRVEKGKNALVDSYSGFWENGDANYTPMYCSLLDKGVTDVVICGLAMDYCVGFTALDAARHGFRTLIAESAVRGVAPDTTAAMISRCKAAGVEFMKSGDIPGILSEPQDLQQVMRRILSAQKHFSPGL